MPTPAPTNNSRQELHLTPRSRRELEDTDLERYMPESTCDIERCAPINIKGEDNRSELVSNAIKLALAENIKRHFFVPMAPNHWQGLYIEKPLAADGLYQIRIFDSLGTQHIKDSRAIEAVLVFLQQCGIQENKIELSLAYPNKQQTGSYACGDFMCAYFLKTKQEISSREQQGITSLSEEEQLTISGLDTLGYTTISESIDLPAYRAEAHQSQNSPLTNGGLGDDAALRAATAASLLETTGNTDITSIDYMMRDIFIQASARIAQSSTQSRTQRGSDAAALLSTPDTTRPEAAAEAPAEAAPEEAAVAVAATEAATPESLSTSPTSSTPSLTTTNNQAPDIQSMSYDNLKTKLTPQEIETLEQLSLKDSPEQVKTLAAGLLFARKTEHSEYKKALAAVSGRQTTDTVNPEHSDARSKQIEGDAKFAAGLQEEELRLAGFKI